MSQRHSLIRDLEFSDKYFADLDLIETLKDSNKNKYSSNDQYSESESDPEQKSFQSNRLPKKNLPQNNNKSDEIEYICLASDEYEQGR